VDSRLGGEESVKGIEKKEGDLLSLGSCAFESAYSFSSCFEEGKGINPEELIGAAHAGCHSMALSSELGKIGLTPQSIHTRSQVTLGKIGDRTRITLIHLETEARVTGISPEKFHDITEATKTSCPVSAALASVPITLDAKLISLSITMGLWVSGQAGAPRPPGPCPTARSARFSRHRRGYDRRSPISLTCTQQSTSIIQNRTEYCG